ncbi:MAG: alpha/beta fold hydrolase [Ardenticatenaceae bacterium]|nr:alpha/beta fold hydrolase [Ardenticatenaceae bacterium]
MTTLLKKVSDFLTGREPDEHTIVLDGQSYHYRTLHVPDHPAESALLIVGLHGLGSTERQLKTLIPLALDRPFIYLSLQAFHPHPTGGYSWFPIEFSASGFEVERKVLAESLDRLARFIQEMAGQYHVKESNVVLVGYSQGAAMTHAYLLRHPDSIAAAVALTGTLVEEAKLLAAPLTKLRDKPLFIGYGTKDPLIQTADMENARDFYADFGVDITYREYPIPHVVSLEEVEDVGDWLQRLD